MVINCTPGIPGAKQQFNSGCQSFNAALEAFCRRDVRDFETKIKRCALDVFGSFELFLKAYLSSTACSSLSATELKSLENITFPQLLALMEQRASPALSKTVSNQLREFKRRLRNPVEHGGLVPEPTELYQAILLIQAQICIYFVDLKNELILPKDPTTLSSELDAQRVEYLEAIARSFEFVDLAGIAPQVGNQIVKVRLAEVFVDLQSVELASFSHLYEQPMLQAKSLVDLPVEKQSQFDDKSLSNSISEQTKIDLSALLERKRVVLLGHPGSGKTTVAKYVAYCIATGKPIGSLDLTQLVPVFIRASDFSRFISSDPGISLRRYITSIYKEQFAQLLEWSVTSGNCFIVIDGLDEIPDAAVRADSIRMIDTFLNDDSKNRVLITSRVVGYRKHRLSSDCTHAVLAELSKSQIRKFLRNWYQAIYISADSGADVVESDSRANRLWEAIASKPGIRKLSRNPLLLTIICLVNYRGTKLPDRRVQLYKIAVDTLVENWPVANRATRFDADQAVAILEPVAFHIFESGLENLVSEPEFRPLLERVVAGELGSDLSNARAFSKRIMTTIEEETGLFLLKGYDDSGNAVYGFLHQTFAEYLTARYLAGQWYDEKLVLSNYLHTSRWHEVLLLMAGHIGSWGVSPVSKLVRQILEQKSPYEQLLHRDLFFVSRILSDNIRVKPDVLEDVMRRLVSVGVASTHSSQLVTVINAMVDLSGSYSPSETIQNLLNPSAHDSSELQDRKLIISRTLGGDFLQLLLLLNSKEFSLENESLISTAMFGLLRSSAGNGNLRRTIMISGKFTEFHFFLISEDLCSRLESFDLNRVLEDSSRTLNLDLDRIWFLHPITDFSSESFFRLVFECPEIGLAPILFVLSESKESFIELLLSKLEDLSLAEEKVRRILLALEVLLKDAESFVFPESRLVQLFESSLSKQCRKVLFDIFIDKAFSGFLSDTGLQFLIRQLQEVSYAETLVDPRAMFFGSVQTSGLEFARSVLSIGNEALMLSSACLLVESDEFSVEDCQLVLSYLSKVDLQKFCDSPWSFVRGFKFFVRLLSVCPFDAGREAIVERIRDLFNLADSVNHFSESLICESYAYDRFSSSRTLDSKRALASEEIHDLFSLALEILDELKAGAFLVLLCLDWLAPDCFQIDIVQKFLSDARLSVRGFMLSYLTASHLAVRSIREELFNALSEDRNIALIASRRLLRDDSILSSAELFHKLEELLIKGCNEEVVVPMMQRIFDGSPSENTLQSVLLDELF